jgi:hypothetical protein
MGGRAGGKDVRTRRKVVEKPKPGSGVRYTRGKTRCFASEKPAMVVTKETGVELIEEDLLTSEPAQIPSPNFVAAKKPGRTDATDWSADELLLDQEFGFKLKQWEFLKQRVKEMSATANELKDEMLAILDLAELTEVAVEDRLVKRYKQESATASEEYLLQAGVPAAKIAAAKELSLKAYRKAVKEGKKSPWRLSASRIGGGE